VFPLKKQHDSAGKNAAPAEAEIHPPSVRRIGWSRLAPGKRLGAGFIQSLLLARTGGEPPGLGQWGARYSIAVAAFSAAVLVGVVAARSAPPRAEDPDWPCQQRLVPKLSAAGYWNGPSLDKVGDWHADPLVADLVRRLAPRRVSTAEGLTAIAAFARTLSNDRQRRLALAFCGLLADSDREREVLIEKLKQIGRRQRELADLVAELATQLNAIPADATGEAAVRRVDLEQRHDFTARNFEEIQHTIRYACETPIELDARLGAWARALQDAASH